LQGISVPPQPQIMVDLQMEQVMPNPDLKSIAKLISQDPGLSGGVAQTGEFAVLRPGQQASPRSSAR
jgi:HD-like signal output (HDOD) protein